MVSLVKNPSLFGGQAFTTPPRLCIDCVHRPIRYGKHGGEKLPPCELNPALDAWDARQACKGEKWQFTSPHGARE